MAAAAQRGPTKGAVALFLLAIFTTIALVIAGTWYAVVQAQQANHQWCEVLTLITADAHPTTPGAREFYAKLHDLEHRFGC